MQNHPIPTTGDGVDCTKANANLDSDYRYGRVSSNDSEQHAACLSDWDQTYHQLDPGQFNGELTDLGFLGIQVFRETTNRSVLQQGSPIDDCVVFGIPLAMDGPGLFSGKHFTQQDFITFNGSDGFHLITPKRFDILAVTVPRIELMQLLALEGIDACSISKSTVLKPATATLHALRDCLASVVNPQEIDPSHFAHLQVQRNLKSGILSNIVSTIRSAKPGDSPSRCFKSRSHLVREIIDWALSKQEDPPSISEICLRFNIGRRVLNYSFIEVVGTSPLNYLRSIRLNGARRDLRKLPSQMSVQEIASQWGFWHLPRFSAEYRKLFGELPSETRQRAAHIELSVAR